MSIIRLTPIATPANAPTGKVELFIDTVDGLLKQIDQAGVVTEITLPFNPVPNTRTVNGHALSSNVVVTPEDVANILHAQADASTITFDIDTNGALQETTLGGNRTLAFTISNNRVFAITLVQDGTGSRTVTWPSGILWPGAVTPTLSTGASKSDTFTFIRTGSGAYLGFIAGQNN